MISNNLYDLFGVLRYQQGSAQTPWRWRSAILAEEGFSSSEGLFILPSVGIFTDRMILPGIFIGISICLLQAWRYVTQFDFGSGFPEVDKDKLQHCFLCCRIVRCTLLLGPDVAFRLQVLWEIIGPLLGRVQFDLEDAFRDTAACARGIGIGYIITESCLTGCARSLNRPVQVATPLVTLAQPCRY